MKAMGLSRSIAAVATLGFALFAGTALAQPSNKWRIELNHSAGNDGSIVFRIAPVGGTAIDVETKVPAKTTENAVAKLLTASLKVALGKAYGVSVDDGEDVLVKKRGKTPDFDLTLVSSSVTGLEIKLERE